jgi:hypothetical protein
METRIPKIQMTKINMTPTQKSVFTVSATAPMTIQSSRSSWSLLVNGDKQTKSENEQQHLFAPSFCPEFSSRVWVVFPISQRPQNQKKGGAKKIRFPKLCSCNTTKASLVACQCLPAGPMRIIRKPLTRRRPDSIPTSDNNQTSRILKTTSTVSMQFLGARLEIQTHTIRPSGFARMKNWRTPSNIKQHRNK